ncbi:hypothetical protein O181_018633 [Austropuccinia psidii MF-1]|uniref:PPPDE domain-containing protein n=1 Tax=Austropuccinia psidii MF-1 TaxID=1389203 RepID=A0A9Q3C9G1_9BASI|nr:hypothetical protein [Austropuccinia psidii MF-1]
MSEKDSDHVHSVKLFVYDLSNGLAKSMSLAWTGQQFDGIWHTSVVYADQVEVFFGQGIMTCQPGQSHHGKPLRIIDLGETMIDPVTFMEYIDELRNTWTAQAYHLLERNCNHFSNELIEFLNGRSIPEDILNLPKRFLSTPLGASMRPMIDQMFRGPNHPPISSPPTSDPVQTPAHLLANVASSAFNSTTDQPLHSSTTISDLETQLKQHVCVVVNFTNERGCPPCRAIAPVYEQLAQKFHQTHLVNSNQGRKSKMTKDLKFVKVDTTLSIELSQRYQIRATPTFKFFIKSKEIGEMKGANPSELETQINLMLFTAYPPHPHLKAKLPKLKALPLDPIQYTQPFSFEKALNKLLSSISPAEDSPRDIADQTFRSIVIPFLEKKTDLNAPDRFIQWTRITNQLLQTLTPTNSFPVLDFLRLAALRQEYIDQFLLCSIDTNPIYEAIRVANVYESKESQLPKPFSLTLLKLLSNALGSHSVADRMIEAELDQHSIILRFLLGRLLDGDLDVKVLASGVCYGLVSRWVDSRVDWMDNTSTSETGTKEEWEMELMSGLVEGLSREAKAHDPTAEMVHRLTATIERLLFLSPFSSSLKSLLESLEFVDILISLTDRADLVKESLTIKDLCEETKLLLSST